MSSSSRSPPESHLPGLTLPCSVSPKGLPLMLSTNSGCSTSYLDGDELHPCAFVFRIAHLWKKRTAKPLSSTADRAAGHLGMKAVAKAEGGFGPRGTVLGWMRPVGAMDVLSHPDEALSPRVACLPGLRFGSSLVPGRQMTPGQRLKAPFQ